MGAGVSFLITGLSYAFYPICPPLALAAVGLNAVALAVIYVVMPLAKSLGMNKIAFFSALAISITARASEQPVVQDAAQKLREQQDSGLTIFWLFAVVLVLFIIAKMTDRAAISKVLRDASFPPITTGQSVPVYEEGADEARAIVLAHLQELVTHTDDSVPSYFATDGYWSMLFERAQKPSLSGFFSYSDKWDISKAMEKGKPQTAAEAAQIALQALGQPLTYQSATGKSRPALEAGTPQAYESATGKAVPVHDVPARIQQIKSKLAFRLRLAKTRKCLRNSLSK